MGSLSRYSRGDRFIKEFGEDLVGSERVDAQKTWKVVLQALGIREFDECVGMYFRLRCVETGEELELTNDTTYFQPDDTTVEEMVDDFTRGLGLEKKDVMRRIKAADLE